MPMGAFIASFCACKEACADIDSSFDPLDAAGFPVLRSAVDSFNLLGAPDECLTYGGGTKSEETVYINRSVCQAEFVAD